jgi:hypothetical protein
MKIFGVRKRFYLPPLIVLIMLYTISALSANMDVKHVYKICPVFIVYTNKILKDNEIAACKNIFVFIRPELKNDERVLKHELTHAKQSYRYCFTTWIFMNISDEYLARFEAEAYATEIKNPIGVKIYSSLIQLAYTPTVPIEIIEGYVEYYWKNITDMEDLCAKN